MTLKLDFLIVSLSLKIKKLNNMSPNQIFYRFNTIDIKIISTDNIITTMHQPYFFL